LYFGCTAARAWGRCRSRAMARVVRETPRIRARREPSAATLAMARDRHLPHALAAVHPKYKVPHRAELVVGTVVAVVAATGDVRGAIGFSSFGVLAYYAIANASAWTLTPDKGRKARAIPVLGLAGCLVLAFALPVSSVVLGAAVLAFGAAAYGVRRAVAARRV